MEILSIIINIGKQHNQSNQRFPKENKNPKEP